MSSPLIGDEFVLVLDRSGHPKYLTVMDFLATAGIGGGTWVNLAFTTNISFSANYVMPRQIVNAPITFTVNPTSAVPGGSTYLRLVADGVNTPTFTGFKEWGGSSGYNNTLGIVNSISFFFDGADYYYSVTQAVGAQPLTIPQLSAAAIASSTPTTITLTLSSALSSSFVPAVSAFTLTNSGGVDTVTNVAVSGTTVTLTKSRTTLSSDVITLAYTAPGSNPLQNSNGDLVPNVSSLAVSNGLATVVVRLTTLAGLTETGDGAAGYNYAGTGANSAYSSSNAGLSAQKIASGQDGYFQMTIGAWDGTSTGPYLGLKTTTGTGNYQTGAEGIYINTNYAYNTGATGGQSGDTVVAPAVGDVVRMRRSGTNIYAEVSKNNGSTFTVTKTWTGVSAAVDLYALVILPSTTSRADKLRGLNVG